MTVFTRNVITTRFLFDLDPNNYDSTDGKSDASPSKQHIRAIESNAFYISFYT